jgi:FkbM family methyltransferase
MGILKDALFKNWNHYTAELPYNLNWLIKLGTEEKQFLESHNILICDIGARGSAPVELTPFFPYMDYLGFDADKTECDRLNSSPHPYRKFSLLPYFIGGDSSEIFFNLYKDRSHSSVYQPGPRYQKMFGGNWFAVDEKVKIKSTTIDEIYSKKSEYPDLIKLDTQGTELDILTASKAVLAKTCLVEVEVEFVEMYKGQPMFHDIAKFMYDQGFELLYLNRVFQQRCEISHEPAKGQIIFADGLFARKEDCCLGIEIDRLVKYAMMLINYGHIDIAHHLTLLYPEIVEILPSISRYFKPKNYGLNMIKKLVVNQLDKFIMLLLHLRKYNRQFIDSDRSWPIR